MWGTFKIQIVYVDGLEETVEGVNDVDLRNGILYLRRIFRGSYANDNTLIGAYPVVNIRKWSRIDAE